MTSSLLSRLDFERLADPTASDADCVRSIAASLIDELGIREPPVDVEMVASLLDIGSVVEDAALPEAGCLICHRDGRFEIRVRGSDSSGRQRFTICHECGHTFFPGFAQQTRFRCSPALRPSQDLDLESLCDLAAGQLLFPPRLFVPDSRASSFGLNGLEELADRYEGSLEATGHRFVATWTEPSALLVLTVRQKPTERGSSAPPKLRLDSAHPEGNWPYFLKHKSVLPNDVFDRALQGEIVGETTFIRGICTQPVKAEVHAQIYPLAIGGVRQPRVIALARRVGR